MVRFELHILSRPVSISFSVKPKSTWMLLKPHFETLVSSFVFPQLAFTNMKQELWDTDPVEYIRNSIGMFINLFQRSFLLRFTQIDEYEDFAAPVSAATTFLFTLVSSRTKTTFMPILGFINSVLDSCVGYLTTKVLYSDVTFQQSCSSSEVWSAEHDFRISALYDGEPTS